MRVKIKRPFICKKHNVGLIIKHTNAGLAKGAKSGLIVQSRMFDKSGPIKYQQIQARNNIQIHI